MLTVFPFLKCRSRLEKIASDSCEAFIKSRPRPEEMPSPLFTCPFQYVLPKFQFTAWDSCMDEIHYHQVKIVIKNCEKGSNDVHDWAKEVLGRADQTQLPPRGLPEDNCHQAIRAANQLLRTFADVNVTAAYLQSRLQPDRTDHCRTAQDWLDRQKEILLLDSESSIDRFLGKQLAIYKEWRGRIRPNSVRKFFDNIVNVRVRKSI